MIKISRFTKNGFTAYNLAGGISVWERADKSVEQAETVKQLTVAEYMDQIPKDETVLVDFSPVWCPPCKKKAPVVDSLVKTNGNQFVLVKVNGGDQTDICKKLKVDGFPACLSILL